MTRVINANGDSVRQHAKHVSVAGESVIFQSMADKETPLMRQYRQIKTRYPDTILLFRLGDFFETFGDDAVQTAKACGITLTKRNNGGASEMPLAGFPHHQLDNYLPKLVRAGFRVAVCEQMEDPKQAKGIVKRDVVEVVTPGVVLADKLLDHNRHTWLCCVVAPPKGSDLAALAYVDVSTGTFVAGDVPVHMLSSVLESLEPAEVLVNRDEASFWSSLLDSLGTKPARTKLDGWLFDADFTQNLLHTHFNVTSLKGFGFEALTGAVIAAGTILHYVGQNQPAAHAQLRRLTRYRPADAMLLDAATRRNLEILSSNHADGRQGALVSILDTTSTPMGARLLREWLQHPLTSLPRIRKRLEVVGGLVAHPDILVALREALATIGDLERLIARVASLRASPRDVASIRTGLLSLPTIARICASCTHPAVAALASSFSHHVDVAQRLTAELVSEPAIHVGSGGIFHPGIHSIIDQYADARTNGKQWIADLQERERQATGIASLRVGSTGVFGYYLEVSNTHKARVPEHYERRQTLANAERYSTPELKALEQTLHDAETGLASAEQQAFDELRVWLATKCFDIQETARSIATIDTLAAFAHCAVQFDYCQPDVHDGTDLLIEGARHPVIERILPPGTTYTTNTVALDTEARQIGIVTGPNMSGKSSYLRQVGVIVFMAHVGCYVPATTARIPLTDRIFTRVGAHDNLHAGESTFLVEMQEAANILNNASQRSLILLDEVGRGTATFDGISIAWAIGEYLHDVVGAKTLFATHYHELTRLAEDFERVFNLQVEVQEVGDTIVFTHRVVEGHSDHSFGIHVARMAGLPKAVVHTAASILQRLEHGQSPVASDQHVQQLNREHLEEAGQLQMFTITNDALTETVRQLDVDNLTPLQALQILTDMKDNLDA